MTRKPTYGVLIGKNGQPKFENLEKIPREQWELLTADEQQDVRERGGYPAGEER